MKRSIYKHPFYVDRAPLWVCPACQAGHLALVKESLHCYETSASIREHSHEYWGPEWIEKVFSCIFRCDKPHCNEPVACSGVGEVDHFTFEGDSGLEEVESEPLRPRFFHPSLVLMDFPKNCPGDVIDALRSSFGLFFSNQNAALNAARMAVEALLNHLEKINNINPPADGRPSLHNRIKALPEKYNDSKELLEAVKWLGNAGSHVGDDIDIDFDDVIMAYDILEAVLFDIYENRSQKLKDAVKTINANKGLPR